MPEENRWCVRFQKNPEAKYKAFCFHFAGGAAAFFARWHQYFNADVEVVCVQMPGRWERLGEPALKSVAEMAKEFDRAVTSELDRPFVVVGYSLGALVAFEWIRLLMQKKARLPIHFFPIAKSAPQIKLDFPKIHHLDDELFVLKMGQVFKSIPSALLQDADMLKAIIPAFKADVKAFETYNYFASQPLDVPITAIGGDQDPLLTPGNLKAWEEQTSSAFDHLEVPGGHFFAVGNEAELIKSIQIRAAESLVTTKT